MIRPYPIVRAGLLAAGCFVLSGCGGRTTLMPLDVADAGFEDAGEAERSTDLGPPPPGWVRIVGGTVPDWTPEMLHGQPRSALNWVELGPKPITGEYWSGEGEVSGRVVGIAPHPRDPDTCYIASASGGVWKTVDGGVTWEPLTDELSNLNHGAIALDPSDPAVVYVGTGEYTTFSAGDGLFRSIDGGVMWERIATVADVGAQVSAIAVDPDDPLVIHVTGRLGYVRSIDGGLTWTRQLEGRASALVVNPFSPNIVFVAQHGVGIFRSIDGGETFTQLTSGLPTDGLARIVMAIAPSAPQTMYAAFGYGSGVEGLFKTITGGNAWTEVTSAPDFAFPQAWYDMYVAVDPDDANRVYLGGVTPAYAVAGILRTTNGGTNWVEISRGNDGVQTHPDHQYMAFGPGVVWEANDGGVWKSIDDGDNWINCNATLAVTQHYDVEVSPHVGVKILGGTQDNGTVERVEDSMMWPQLIEGDGGAVAWDHEDPTVRYGTYVYLTVFRFIDDGFANITGPWGGEPVNFIAPLVMDPQDADTLLGGTNRVWRTTNASAEDVEWEAISEAEVAGGGVINVIAARGDVIYVGSNVGTVWHTEDGGDVWLDRTADPLPLYGQSSDIEMHPEDPSTVYVSFYGTSGTRVVRSFDSGETWDDLTHELPVGVGVTALAIDWSFEEPRIYIGTGAGIWSSDDAGLTWVKDGSDLPNVNIGDLEIDAGYERLVAGTFGRGTWWSVPASCTGDITGDGQVAVGDLLAVLAAWGSRDPAADLDGSGTVDIADLLIVLAAFGPC